MRILGVRRVTHEESERLETEYWASKTMAERVIAGWALRENDLIRRARGGANGDQKRTGWVLRRVTREPR